MDFTRLTNITMLSLVLLPLGTLAHSAKPVNCPQISMQNLQNLHNDKQITVDGHKWYLKATYKENHSFLGTFLPLAITADNIEHSKEITFEIKLTDRECQYKLAMPEVNATGYLLFSRVGE